jgi:hypothetical protein
VSVLTWLTHHRLLAVGLSLTLIVLAVLFGLWYFVLRAPATQVDLRQALRLYRADQRAGRTSGSGQLPPSGVYRYRTTGGEQLSLAGINRHFPADTEAIVTDARCATVEWEPFQQHTEGLVECPMADGGLGLSSALSYEQIAGTKTTDVIRCPTHTYFVPPDPKPGLRWHGTCHATGQTVGVSGLIVGTSSVRVKGTAVPALHTRLTLTVSGGESGTNPNDYWISLKNGVILRQQETVTMAQQAGPLGSVRYSEQMAITIDSLAPVR